MPLARWFAMSATASARLDLEVPDPQRSLGYADSCRTMEARPLALGILKAGARGQREVGQDRSITNARGADAEEVSGAGAHPEMTRALPTLRVGAPAGLVETLATSRREVSLGPRD